MKSWRSNLCRRGAGIAVVVSVIAGATTAGAATSSPAPTFAAVTADINSFANQMTRPGYVSYASSSAVQQ